MKLSASQLAKRAEKAQGHKSNWDAMLSDAYEFALPMRNTYNSQAPGQQKMDRVFDSTAINSVQNFASILQQGVTPPFQEFLDFLPGVDIPEQNQEEARKQLKEKQKQLKVPTESKGGRDQRPSWELRQNLNPRLPVLRDYCDRTPSILKS